MCGILILIDNENTTSINDFDALNILHNHRGPDALRSIKVDRVYMGTARLKIHDLSDDANQPYLYQDGRYTIVFNGAIYNYRALRKGLVELGHNFRTDSDTEVLLIGFLHWGAELLDKLRGMYSFCIFDRHKNEIFVARDPLGVKPLHFFQNGDFLMISSEIKPILNSKLYKKKIDEESLTDFFLYQSPAPGKTFFSGINIFPSGHFLRVNCDKLSTLTFNCFWDISDRKGDQEITIDEFENEIAAALKDVWQVDRKIGLQLSGGVDSSLIAAITSGQEILENYQSFSAIFDNKPGQYSVSRSEEKFIDIVAQKYNLESHKFSYDDKEIKEALIDSIEYFEMPLHGASTSIYHLLSKSVKEHVDVVITGEGVDDIFNGYIRDWYPSPSISSYLPTFCDRDLIKTIMQSRFYDQRLHEASKLAKTCVQHGYSPDQILSAITTKFGLPNLLARHDRMFMASAVEGRPFFADKHFFDLRMRMESSLIHENKEGKVIFKKLLSKYFPSDFVYRKKIGFSSPFGDWLSNKEIWGSYVDNLELDVLAQYMNVDVIIKILDSNDTLQKWSGSSLNLIMCLTSFSIWHKMYMS